MVENGEDVGADYQEHRRHINKMKATRFRIGCSQSDMARMLGITQATYNRIENEVNRTSDEMLERIAALLHLRKSELYEDVSTDERSWRSRVFPVRSAKMEPPTQISDEVQKEEQAEGVNPRDIPTVLKELKELADAGVITEGQFEQKRKELLARL